MDVEVLRSFDQQSDIRGAWDELVESTSASIHLSFDWCRCWWRHYGARRQLCIVLCREGAQLVGIIPMFHERISIGPIAVDVLKVVSSDSTLCMCNLPIRTDLANEVLSSALQALREVVSYDLIAFGPMIADSVVADAGRAVGQRNGTKLRLVGPHSHDVFTLVQLPSSFEAYLADLPRDDRKTYRRRLRRLFDERDVRVDVLTEPRQITEEFQSFVDLHQTQWIKRGHRGHFADWPGATQFHHDLATEMAHHGRVRLVRVTAGDTPIGYQYGFAMGDTAYALLAARRTEPDWDRYGLGHMAFFAFVEHEIGLKRRFLDVGRGHYGYKRRFGGIERALCSIVLVRNDKLTVRRVDGFRRLAGLLDKLYYRIWFSRVAPRFRLDPGPLWNSWIRSRI